MTSEIKAAIDIGTNSMHLVVARTGPDGGFDVVTREKEMTKLGSGEGEMKHLAPDAIDRGISTLERFVELASSFGDADLVVVATSAVREAANRQEFIDRAAEVADVEVEVISGFEEARLIHLGVLQALPVYDQRILLVDIGGGSTELLIGQRSEVFEARSMKLGSLRVTQRFFSDGKATKSSIQECRRSVRSALAPVAYELSGHQPEMAVGSSGTVSTLAEVLAAQRGEQIRKMNGATFARSELDRFVSSLKGTSSADRANIRGLDERRVDLILGGSVVLLEILDAFEIDQVTVSDYALREGVLFDRFVDSSDAGLDHLADLRRSNAERLARQLDPDPDHALQTAKLACQMFDRTSELHGLGPTQRELLWCAAVVHNVGLFISHSSHHKHTYYVVRNCERLTGFSEHEIELMALIARYHRKSLPTDKHSEYASLSDSDKHVVSVLAGLLRLSIGLDRRHAGTVSSVRVITEGDKLVIKPVSGNGDDLSLEIFAAQRRTRLLSRSLGVDVEISEAPEVRPL